MLHLEIRGVRWYNLINGDDIMELKYNGSGYIFYNKKSYKCDLYINRKYGGILIKISV